MLVVDGRNHRVRRVTMGGAVTTVAGSGAYGSANGPALSATFRSLLGIAVARDGTVVVSEHHAHVLRAIAPPRADGARIVTTLAGFEGAIAGEEEARRVGERRAARRRRTERSSSYERTSERTNDAPRLTPPRARKAREATRGIVSPRLSVTLLRVACPNPLAAAAAAAARTTNKTMPSPRTAAPTGRAASRGSTTPQASRSALTVRAPPRPPHPDWRRLGSFAV